MAKGITCKQAVDYISKKEESRLSAVQRFQLWRHLAVCSLCRLFSRQNSIIIKALKNSSDTRADLSDQQKQEIIASIVTK